jgi:hypothetical protein
MTTRHQVKLVHEGEYAAEVDVELVEDESGWSPYLSVKDALKLDEVREALRLGHLQKARALARVFQLTPIEET